MLLDLYLLMLVVGCRSSFCMSCSLLFFCCLPFVVCCRCLLLSVDCELFVVCCCYVLFLLCVGCCVYFCFSLPVACCVLCDGVACCCLSRLVCIVCCLCLFMFGVIWLWCLLFIVCRLFVM